jgi:hypothetical protein
MSRPTKRTPEIIRKIEEVAALDGSVEEMAYYAGVHRDTMYLWLKEDSEFSDRIAELRERPVLKARQTFVKALDEPEYALKYLERKKKKEFSTRTELTGADGEKLPAPIYGGNSITE